MPGYVGPNGTGYATDAGDCAQSAVQPLVRRFDWMRSNFCEPHAEMAEMSSGPCPWCRLEAAKKAAWAVVNSYDSAHGHLVKNIEALRAWLEVDDA